MSDQPSPLAVKLATAFHPKGVSAAEQVDNVIFRHQMNEHQRIHDENKLKPGFCENIGVFRNKDRSEFFELQLLPAEPDMPYKVQFKRYAVPGRYWVYAFQWQPTQGLGQGPRVVYGSEGTEPLAKSLKMIETDLSKPQVVELFERAFSAERVVLRYHHDALALLEMIAPKSKAYRIIHKLCEKTMKERNERFVSERAAQNKASL